MHCSRACCHFCDLHIGLHCACQSVFDCDWVRSWPISIIYALLLRRVRFVLPLPFFSFSVPFFPRFLSMTMNYLLLNLNSIHETLLSVLYFSTYDCVYTDLVLSGCVVILKIFH